MIFRSLLVLASITFLLGFRENNKDLPFPKNCSTIAYCSELRGITTTDQYTATFQGFKNDAVYFNLKNTAGNELTLYLHGIQNSRYRVIIEEPDKHRFKLQHALDGEPNIRKLNVGVGPKAVTASDQDKNDYVIVHLSPFSMDFYIENIKVAVFEENTLIMKNTNDSQAFAFSINYPKAKRLVGLHEHADSVNLRHTSDRSQEPYRLKNNDFGAVEFNVNTTLAMYGSVPLLYGFGPTTSAVFLHNAAEMFVEIDSTAKSARFMVESGTLDLFVLLGPSLQNTLRQYTNLTGTAQLPQLWALGYHQCRIEYNDTQDVMNTISNFDNNDFPVESIWLHRNSAFNQKWFTWDINIYPDPVGMLDWVDAQAQRKIIIMVESNIKVDDTYTIYLDAKEKRLFVQNPNGTDFVNLCWPEESSWIDFLNPKAREYYGTLYSYDRVVSTPALAGFWNDMDEPTVFDNLYERTLPSDSLHYGGVKHKDIHNAYSLLHSISTYNGLIERDNGRKRPFILSRAVFAGSQRYTAKWSGDNWGYFLHLRYSVPMALSASLSGINLYGADIPGFFLGNYSADNPELLIRWYQIGAWIPFFRAHAHSGPRREPFVFDKTTQLYLRAAFSWRYSHLPYWYTLFYEHNVTGDPIVRPLFYEYSDDEETYDLNDQFLLGKNILVASVYESNMKKVPVYFPGGTNQLWYQIASPKNTKVYKGGQTVDIDVDISFIPIFYKAGSIIVQKERLPRSTYDMQNDPHTIHIIPGQDQKAKGTIFIDDYESFDYLTENKYLYYKISYDALKGQAVQINQLNEAAPTGELNFTISGIKIYELQTDGTTYKVVNYIQTASNVELANLRFQEKEHQIIFKLLLVSACITFSLAFKENNKDLPFPKNCSTVAYCSELRGKTTSDQYTATFQGFKNDAVLLNLRNTAGTELTLSLHGIENSRYRVIIEEPDKHRFKLQHVLDGEPIIRKLNVGVGTKSVTVSDLLKNDYAEIHLSPFSIDFYIDGSTKVAVFKENTLTMKNTNDSQAFAFSINYPEAKRLIGLHEHGDWVNLRHTADGSLEPYRLKNTDFGDVEYDVNTTRAMYGSVPLLYGFGPITSAVFLHNAAEMYVEIDSIAMSAHFMVESGTLDLFVLLGPTIQSTLRQYMNLTGTAQLPQLWTLGYHQCRIEYNSTEDVIKTISNFDKYDFPVETLWLVRNSLFNQKWFTWDINIFPDPVGMLDWVDAQAKRKVIVMAESNIKVDATYQVYSAAKEQSFFVQNPNGTDFVNLCWGEESSWIDFLNPKAREYYGTLYSYDNIVSTPALAGFWNDMDEPTLFDNLYERTLPSDSLHFGGVKHKDLHNAYSLLHSISTYNGLIERDNGRKRPFILSRAVFAGSQRYTAKWSGDNWGYFLHLRYSVPMALSASLSGINLYGADIPGFYLGNYSANNHELLIRWYQIGVWIPFFRAHADSGPRREPFVFDDKTQSYLRTAFSWRYNHLPYWYTLFYEHNMTGDPIIRPLLYEYYSDEQTYDLNDQFLLGSNILVASVYESNVEKVPVYLPGGKKQLWYQIASPNYKVYKGGQTVNIDVDISFIPIFYKGGSIIVQKERLPRSTYDMKDDSHTIHIIPDQDNKAEGTIFIDDYESFDYITKNKYFYYKISYDGSLESEAVTISQLNPAAPTGDLNFTISGIKVYEFQSDDTTYKVVNYIQTASNIQLTNLSFQGKEHQVIFV